MRQLLAFVFAMLLGFAPSYALADERDDAVAAARGIMDALAKGQFKDIWQTKTSKFFKEKVPSEETFLMNLSMGRNPLGAIKSSQLIDVAFSTTDPGSGYTGRIYAVTFKNSYPAGSFYERIVVIRESDGLFRMSGVWGTPAPQ